MGQRATDAGRRAAARGLAVVAMSFALAWLCLMVPREAGSPAPIWLPNATLLAILLLSPRHRWQAYAGAGFLGLILANLAFGSPALVSTALALCNSLEVLFAATLLVNTLGRRPDLSRPRIVVGYSLIVAAAAIGSAAAAALFLSSVSGAPRAATFAIWAAADFAGLVTVTPCLMLLANNRPPVRKLASLQAWPLLLLLLVVAAVFSQDRYPLTYVMVCVLLLATWRLGMTGAALGVLGTLLISVGATLAGHGPFALMQTSLVERVLALQLFLAVCFYLSVPVAIQGARARALRDRLVQALASARSARAKYRRIADGAQDIIVQTDRERILYVSPSCRRLGYAPAELVGRTIAELAHPDDLERVEALRARFFEAPQEIAPSDWRLRIRTASGAYRWLEGTPNLLRGRRGEAVAIETILRDVTESLAAEEALAASEARYRLLADHLTDMAACYGDDGVVRFVSPAVKALLGYEPEALVGRQIAELVHPEDVARCGAEFARHRIGADAGPFKIEYRMFRADGSVAWLEAHPRPTFDPDTGAFVEWVDVVRDIGERKTLEAELRAARAEAEASAQAKSDFLANMSHELRTPLTSVIGFGKLAEASAGLEGPVRTYVERMSQASTSLLALVNDILDFSKLEAGDVTFRPRPVDVSELVRASFDLFEAQAEPKGLTLTLADGWPAGLQLDLDPDRLRQVLLNLIGNAVKFTQAGGVTVTPRYDPDACALTVEVRDTGPGITAEGQARLFQRFSQVDGSQTRQYGGTGLGLAICKGIVEAMGGRISVASRPGRGSAFAFTVPAAPAQDQPAGSALRGGDRIRLLLADDHADIRELVVLLLGDRVEVTAVEDGEAAVRVAARRRFDVMLLDQRMPRLDGPGVLARIRGAAGPNRSTPALAFSAEGDSVGSRRIERMGFDGLVTKPVSAVELISAIAQALRDAPAPPCRSPGTAAAARTPAEA